MTDKPATVRWNTPQDAQVMHLIVRRGFSWANIYVRPMSNPEGKHPGVEVMVNSDHGVFGHAWTCIGEDWRSFLSSLSFDYAMGKFRGRDLRVPKPHEESCADIRKYLDEQLAEESISAEDHKALYEAADPGNYIDDVPKEGFFREFDRLSGGLAYQLDYWEHDFTMDDPQAVQFWDRLWVPFADAIRPVQPAATPQ